MQKLTDALRVELTTLRQAAAAAREAATHEESKPENKYDTRGLEASYLAGAQAERVAELEAALKLLASVEPRSFGDGERIALTAWVELERESERSHYLLVPVGGGHKLSCQHDVVTAVTTLAPLGRALLGKVEGDSFELSGGKANGQIEIISVR